MENISITRVNKTVISSTSSDEQSIEISRQAIKNGFLRLFPGPGLAVFLYLITHCNTQGYLETNPTIIASFLPEEYGIKDITEALKFLEKNDIIEFPSRREGDYTYKIKVNLAQIEAFLNQLPSSKSKAINNRNTYYNQDKLRKLVLEQSRPTQQEIYQALLTFVPPDDNLEAALADIEKWLETFEPILLQELVRRVVKWLEKNNNPPDKAYHYLKGIIDDWYQKEIFDYKRLQYFDRLYRETRELAAAYGITNWQNVKPVHMETFLSWLTEGYPLSSTVVKYAIKEAFKRKSNSHPSLKYIEDNFINPWKKARIKTISEARAFLKKHRPEFPDNKSLPESASTRITSRADWEKLYWDLEDFK